MDQVDSKNLIVGLDVGSTTVKSVVVDASTDQIIWSDYQRHDTKQPEKCLEFLKRMEADVGIKAGETRIFVTSTGPWQESISLMGSSEPTEKTKPKMSSKSF